MKQSNEPRRVGRPENPIVSEPEDREGWVEYEPENLPENAVTPDVYEHLTCGYPEFDMMIDNDVIHIRMQDIPLAIPHEEIYPNREKKPVWLRGLIKQANQSMGQEDYKSPAEKQEIHKLEVARLIKVREQEEQEEVRRKAEKEEMRLRRLYFRHHLPEIKRQVTIVEVNTSVEKFRKLKKQKRLEKMTCRRCNSWTLKECNCKDLMDRLRTVCCGHNACVLEKWCVICDRHEIFCTCKFKYGSTLIPQYLFYGCYLRKAWYTPLEKQYLEHMEKSNVG